MQVEENSEFDTTKFVTISKNELPSQLQRSLAKIAQKEGYSSYEVLSRAISTDGGNYMAVLYEADIKGRTNDGEKETNTFIKYVISKEHVNIIDLSELFSKELLFYTELSTVFTELENEATVPVEERYKSVKSYNESSTEAIILQNLTKEGFNTVYRMNVMPLKFAELSVQQLAKFHGMSFVIEQKKPEFFERKIKTLEQSVKFDDNMKSFCKKLYYYSVTGLECEWRNKLNNKLPELIDKYSKYLAGDETKVKCLCHGDYRMNNILLKATAGVITEVIPVDYQLLYYGSPIIDFIYFIFGATDKEFRRNHLNHLKDMYFETLKNYLKYFEIDIDTVYTKKMFETDYYNCVDYGMLFVLFLLPIMVTVEVPDFDKIDVSDVTVNLDHVYNDRLKGVIEDMVELGKL